MKQSKYMKLIVTLLAFACFCCSCSTEKGPDAKNRKDRESKITSSAEDKDISDDQIEDSISDTETWVSEPSDNEDVVADTSDGVLNLSLPQPAANSALGTANCSNGGFATGDEQNSYYVTFPSEDRIAIVKEDRASGTKTPIYTTVPKDAPNVDSLNIVGDALYFRENLSEKESFMIVKVNVNDSTFDVIDNGEIDSFSAYGDHLYYADSCNLVRCDLDGQNKTTIYESEHDAVPPRIPYCFIDGKIYFATPAEYEKDGYFFGKLCSMDLDGKNLTEINADVDVCNSEFFMYDGEKLFFVGTTEADGMCIYSCKLDGSDLESGDKGMPRSMNFIAGNYIMATDAEIFLKNDGNGYELIDSGNIRWSRIVLVENDLYYIDDDETKSNLPVMTRISLLGGPKEALV